jgi:hypothetical protein
MGLLREEDIRMEAKDLSFTGMSRRGSGCIDGKSGLNDLCLKVYAWTECLFVNFGAHICCHTIFLSGMVLCVILRIKKGDRVCYSVYTDSNRVGAHEAFDIYSRDRHLKPEKQKVPDGTVCPPRRFQRPRMETLWEAEHKQYGSSVSRSQSIQCLH